MTSPTTPALSNPYGVQLFTVLTPSGSELHSQTQEEASWYEDRRDRYKTDNRFVHYWDFIRGRELAGYVPWSFELPDNDPKYNASPYVLGFLLDIGVM